MTVNVDRQELMLSEILQTYTAYNTSKCLYGHGNHSLSIVKFSGIFDLPILSVLRMHGTNICDCTDILCDSQQVPNILHRY